MKYLLVIFAIVAVVAANPEPERERRGILGGLSLGAPAIAVRPAIAAVATPVLAPRVIAPIASPILPLGKVW